jgi:hypothetical protein
MATYVWYLSDGWHMSLKYVLQSRCGLAQSLFRSALTPRVTPSDVYGRRCLSLAGYEPPARHGVLEAPPREFLDPPLFGGNAPPNGCSTIEQLETGEMKLLFKVAGLRLHLYLHHLGEAVGQSFTDENAILLAFSSETKHFTSFLPGF